MTSHAAAGASSISKPASSVGEFTPGPWHVGHFADDSHSCNCTGILSEHHFGSVAQITIDNGLAISEGGNDGPPLEEAKANARLIAAGPDLLAALLNITAGMNEAFDSNPLVKAAEVQAARAAIAKATVG